MPKKTPRQNPNISYLWPTPILKKKLDGHRKINAELIELFDAHRRKHEKRPGPVYSSRSNLFEIYQHHPAFSQVVKFIMDGVFEVASGVNAPFWRASQDIDVKLTGVWFQTSNGHGFHETHIHGNCSWSGVYYVQTEGCSRSPGDTKDGLLNGITRFYGPHMEYAAGGHAEFGNLYLLEDMTWDSYPEDGMLVVFPAHLKHMVFPYSGDRDRIAVSFHAQVHGTRDIEFDHTFI